MQSIGDVKGSCSACGWWGTVDEAEPDVDGDGSLGCPQCSSVVHFGAPNKVLHPTAFLAWVIVFVLGFMLGAEYVLYRLGGG
jgi:hypothetical protein